MSTIGRCHVLRLALFSLLCERMRQFTPESERLFLGTCHCPFPCFVYAMTSPPPLRFNQSFVDAAVAATNVRYGGRGIRVRRVVFINGSIDPWHAMGLTAARSRHAPVIYVNGQWGPVSQNCNLAWVSECLIDLLQVQEVMKFRTVT